MRGLRTVLLLLVGALWLVPLLAMLATALQPPGQPPTAPRGLLPRVTEADLGRRVDDDGDAGAASAASPAPDDADRAIAPFTPAWTVEVARSGGDNLAAVLDDPSADFPRAFRNSILVTVLATVAGTLSSAVVAFGLARLRWRGRHAVFLLVLATLMIPFPVVMAPLYLLFRALGWIGTFRPLWVPSLFGSALAIFLLRQFFLTIPRELDEAARIDGCTHVGVFRRIILPLARPALLVAALFQAIGTWNDFVGPLVYLNHQDDYTLPLALFMYQSQHGGTPWRLVMMASVLTVLPVLVAFLLAQRAFIEGVATTGRKG